MVFRYVTLCFPAILSFSFTILLVFLLLCRPDEAVVNGDLLLPVHTVLLDVSHFDPLDQLHQQGRCQDAAR